MRHRFALWPYKMGSKSAAALSRALGIPQIKHRHSAFIGNPNKVVINWGAGELSPQVLKCRILNRLGPVNTARNKLSFFQHIGDKAQTVPWTTSREVAAKWLSEKAIVVARKSLTESKGHGIIIVEPGNDLPNVPLYTKYIPKDAEYRIHILGGKIIFRQRKIKDPNIGEPKSWKIRSHDNGFIFQHSNADGSMPLKVPPDVEKQALAAFAASGLDFCGMDILWNKKQGRAYVIEANTAVGLEGATVTTYARAFKEMLK